MKKMNFYFNSMKWCLSVLAMVVLFSATSVQAGGDPSLQLRKASTSKKMAVGGTATLTTALTTAITACGGSAVYTPTVTVTTTVIPNSVTVTYYDANGLTFTSTKSNLVATTPTALPTVSLPVGVYTSRAVVVDATTTGTQLEFGDGATFTVAAPADATAPVAAPTAASTFTLNASSTAATCGSTITASGFNTRNVSTNIGVTFTENCSLITSADVYEYLTLADANAGGGFLYGTLRSSSYLFAPGIHYIRIFATSGGGGTLSPPTTVTVKDVTPPTFTDYTAATLAVGGGFVRAPNTTSYKCGGSFTANVTTCNGTAAFPFPAATDNCTPTVTLVSGALGVPMTAGPINLAPGAYVLTFQATDPTGLMTTCNYNVTVTSTAGNAFSCVGNLNLSMTSCPQVLSLTGTNNLLAPNSCTTANLVLELGRGGIWTKATTSTITAADAQIAAATLNSSDIGTTIQYRIRDTISGTSCWGNLAIEDKTPPTITAPANIALDCGSSVTNLCATGQFPTATNRMACATQANPGFGGDCSTFEQYYTDVVIDYPCSGSTAAAPAIISTALVGSLTGGFAGSDASGNTTTGIAAGGNFVTTGFTGFTGITKVVIRTWRLKDKWGNYSNIRTQVIFIKAPVNPTVYTDNPTVSCTAVAAGFATTPGTGGTAYRPSTTADFATPVKTLAEASSCELYAILKNVMIVDICGGGKQYMRTWQIYSRCSGAQVGVDIVQTVTVRDNTAPTATISVDNYTLTAGTPYCFTMNGMQMDNQPTATRTKASVSQVVGGSAINVTALANQSTCLMATVSLKLTNIDATNCAAFSGAPTVTFTDSRLTYNATTGVATGTFMFADASEVQSFTVSVTDDCGNKVSQVVNVSYQDNANPQASCKTATIQLPEGTESARLTVDAINNSSKDNCGIRQVMFRKMGTTNCWSDALDYTCAEVGDNMVVLRVVDYRGLVSECMVNVTVNSKGAITCSDLAPITVVCTDPALLNYNALFATDDAFRASVSNTSPCATFTVSSTAPVLAVTCGAGTATKTWTISSTTLTGSGTTCKQVLTVTPVRGFRVTPLADEFPTCSYSTTAEEDRLLVVGRLKLVHNGDNDGANGTTAVASRITCSAPVVDVTESVYSNTQYCKVIVRTFVIKDACNFSTCASSITNATAMGTLITDGDLQSVPCGTARGIIVFTKTIYIKDKTAPTSDPITVADICDNSTTCSFGFTQDLNGKDLCDNGSTTNSGLQYAWSIVNSGSVTVSSGLTKTVSATGLAFGTYTVYYTVSDFCGNMSQRYSFTVTGKDCKLPEILVHDKIVALGGQRGVRSSGMVTLTYADISNFLRDNCTEFDYLDSKIVMEKGGATSAIRPISTSPNRTLMFNCTELGDQKVRVWTVDKSGNWNFAISTITVQDNEGICVGNLIAQVSGGVRTEGNSVVPNVSVSASVNGANAATGDVSNGAYVLNLAPASNVQVRAAKTNNDDAATGVTTFDIAKVSQHVLDIEKLATPYKLIAADVDKSGEIDATDMLHMRRFILKITPSLPGGNFRFVDKAYGFRNAANPFGEDFPEVVNIASLTTNAVSNFVAVKLGDVNDSYNGTVIRSARTLNFNVNDMNVNAGTEYTVNISADKMDAASFQGTFSFNGATVKSVKAGTLANMTDGNFGIFANAVTTSWNGKTQDAADVMTITFVANKSGKLSDMLTVNSALTQAVANDEKGSEMNVNLKFNTGKVAGGEFALYQNQPNPVAGETTIGFNLPKDGTARLTVTSVDGKVVKVINGDYKAGYNVVTINKSDIQASGVFYYRLETADHSASKKMVIIE